MAKTLPVRRMESLLEEIQQMRDLVMGRAHDIFERNGSPLGHDLENWLAAERELVWKPPIEVLEADGELRIRVAVAGMDPKDIDVEVDADHVIVKGEAHHEHHDDSGRIHTCEFQSGRLFRSVDLPRKVDPARVKADFCNGLLTISAKIADESRARKVSVRRADASGTAPS